MSDEKYELFMHALGDTDVSGRRKRGGQPGNLNAVKKGKRSERMAEAKRRTLALEEAPIYASSPEEEFRTAMRWSRTDRAALVIAVTKRREQIRYLQDLAGALEQGKEPPTPPVVSLTMREARIYRLYLEWQRWVKKLARRPATEEDRVESVAEVRRVADEALEEWELVGKILEGHLALDPQ